MGLMRITYPCQTKTRVNQVPKRVGGVGFHLLLTEPN